MVLDAYRYGFVVLRYYQSDRWFDKGKIANACNYKYIERLKNIIHKIMFCIKLKQIDDDLFKSEDYIDFFNGLKLGLNDNLVEKKLFDKSLIEEDYKILNYCIWELPYEVDFAISMMHELEYDICGNRINYLESIEPLKKIYLNIFRQQKNHFVYGRG